MTKFSNELRNALPSPLRLDGALIQLLDWIGDENQVYRSENTGERYGHLYTGNLGLPEHPDVIFEPPDPDHSRLWIGTDDPNIFQNLSPILRSGSDGSWIALWRSPTGEQMYVHLGSGSGSTYAGVMVKNSVDLIRLLAIGYPELCWPGRFGMTPYEVWISDKLEGDFRPPIKFQTWVAATFGKEVPRTALAVLEKCGDMDADPGDDPFLQWLAKLHK